MSPTRLFAAALLALTAMPAAAQDVVELNVGATVYGPERGVVGTILQAGSHAVVLNTGSKIATLSADSFVSRKIGPTIGYTRDQLEAAVEAVERQQEARLAGALVAGAQLRSNDGVVVGTIQAINPDGSVIVTTDKSAFQLERAQLGADARGVILLFSAAQLEAALERNGG